MQLLFSPILEIEGKLVVRSGEEELLNENVMLKPSDLLDRTVEGIQEGTALEVMLER